MACVSTCGMSWRSVQLVSAIGVDFVLEPREEGCTSGTGQVFRVVQPVGGKTPDSTAGGHLGRVVLEGTADDRWTVVAHHAGGRGGRQPRRRRPRRAAAPIRRPLPGATDPARTNQVPHAVPLVALRAPPTASQVIIRGPKRYRLP